MRPPRRWPQFWALALIPPAGLAVLSMSVTMAGAAVVATFGLATVTALAMTSDSLRGLPVPLVPAARFGTYSTVTCLGFGGLFAYFGPAVAVPAAVYACTAAWALASSLDLPEQNTGTYGEPEEPTGEPSVITADAVRRMTGAELCQTWRRSYMILSSTRGLRERAQVVWLRQMILDEMEIRDPAGLRAWLLRAGARTAGAPDRFLGRDGWTTQRERP
jgi:hypothetical protein